MSTFTDILPTLAHYLNPGDLVKVASTSLHCSYIVHCHLEERREVSSTKYFDHSVTLYQILLISSFPNCTIYTFSYLQLLRLCPCCSCWSNDQPPAPRGDGTWWQLTTARSKDRCYHFCHGCSDQPVFEFHSTVMMNFITTDATCCAYLTLLLQEKQ